MKRIFIFPTIEEAKAFILTEPRDPVFVGGVGMAEIAAATLRAVKAKKPQLVVLAGIAAGDAGFAEPHPGFTADDRAGHAADGTQRQTPEGNPENTSEGYLPEVENMEGAAFFAVCDALGVACCQIRAVSNYVGEPFGQWAVEEAVGNLTEKLNQIFENNE